MERVLYTVVIFLLTWNETRGCFFQSTKKTVYVKTGADYYSECECNAPGYGIKSLKWLDNHDRQIATERPGTGQKVFTVINESCCVNLHIPLMTKAMSGTYKCVTNFEGNDFEQLHYLVAYDPITINPPEKQHIILGNNSLIRCEVHSEPHSSPIVTWYKEENGNFIRILPNDKYVYTSEGLFINNVSMEDRGKYSCTALDILSSDGVDKDIDVEIVTIPAISEINVYPDVKVEVGDQLRIECKGDGVPHPEYIFRKVDGELKNISEWDQKFNSLFIHQVVPEDQGTYECIAQSLAGVVSKKIFIKVNVPPVINHFPNMTVEEGKIIQLVCNASGRPAPQLSIIFIEKDDDIEEIDDSKIIENYSFKTVNRHDKGIYVCNATNEVDYDLKYMYLNVEHRPHFDTVAELVWGWEGIMVNLSCPVDSNPPTNVTWRFQGNEILTDEQIRINKDLMNPINENGETSIVFNASVGPFPYGVYECKAMNKLGEDIKVIDFKEGHVPPVISKAEVLAVQHTSVVFKIDGPDTVIGPAVQGYKSEYDKSENYNITHIHMNRTWSVDRPFVIDNLEPNTTYSIRFASINQVGIGPWSEVLEFLTAEPSVPSVPEWASVTDLVNITSMDEEISWLPAKANGADVEYYTLRYCLDDEEGTCYEMKVPANVELKLDNTLMEFNRTYFINLTAHNSVGDSEAANLTVLMLTELLPTPALLSAGALIGISVVIVFICLLLLDLLLLLWRRQGIIASCCLKKKKDKVEEAKNTRDKKGLLNDNREREPDETLKSPDNRPKEFEYNRTTGIITGRHSAV